MSAQAAKRWLRAEIARIDKLEIPAGARAQLKVFATMEAGRRQGITYEELRRKWIWTYTPRAVSEP